MVSLRRRVMNFIEYYSKPFTTKVIAENTSIDEFKVRKTIAYLKSIDYVKSISKEDKYTIYIKNTEYVNKSEVNVYGYNYQIMEKIYNSLKFQPVSIREVSLYSQVPKTTALKYIKAMWSLFYVNKEDGIYQKTEFRINYDLVGSKIIEGEFDKMTKKKNEKVLVGSDGREYPTKILDKQIVKRDRMVTKLLKKAKDLNERIAKEKAKMVAEIEDYLADTAEQYGENWKGNAELLSFDGSAKIEVKYKERIQFTEKLQIAKQKIDDCLIRWSEDSNINLQAVIREAFQVDKKGEVAKGRILSLRKYNIKDKEWKLAMDLINEAIEVTSTKQYIAFYEREDINKSFNLITLNFSSIE